MRLRAVLIPVDWRADAINGSYIRADDTDGDRTAGASMIIHHGTKQHNEITFLHADSTSETLAYDQFNNLIYDPLDRSNSSLSSSSGLFIVTSIFVRLLGVRSNCI